MSFRKEPAWPTQSAIFWSKRLSHWGVRRMDELITAAKYWRYWDDPRLIALVLNNRDLNLVTWEQRVLSGDPKFVASQNLPDFPYACRVIGFGIPSAN